MTALRIACCAAVAGGGLLAMAAEASASPAYVRSTVNLRSAAGTNSEVVAKIPAGSLVQASNCGEWCEVNWQGKTGFAIKSALDTSGRVPARRAVARSYAPGATATDEVVAGGPAYYGPPAVYYGYPYPYYRPFGYYRYRPYYGYRYGWRRRW